MILLKELVFQDINAFNSFLTYSFMKKLGVAIIGCGEVAKVHALAVSKNKNVELRALCDIKKQKAKHMQKQFGGRIFWNYKKMLKENDIDIIHICTPHYLHAQMAIDSLNSGKHVIVEKPVSLSMQDAIKILDLSKKIGKLAIPILQHRYDENLNFVRSNLNKLGKINIIKVDLLCNRNKNYYSGWRGKKIQAGGGVLINQGIHYIDLLLLMGGKIENFSSKIENYQKISEVDDSINISIKFKKNILASFNATSNSIYDFKYNFEIHGSNGSCYFNDKTAEIEFKEKNKLRKIEFKEQNKKNKSEKDYYGTGHENQINDVINSIIKNTKPKITIEDALPSLSFILDCYKNEKINKKHI